MYERLLHDSTENLLRPTAVMIGNAKRTSISTNQKSIWATTAGKKRQLASANIRQRRPRPPSKVQNEYVSNYNVSSSNLTNVTNLGP